MTDLPIQKFVVLLRVSTHSQGADGHGDAAQRRDIQIFLDGLNGSPEVIQEFVEVESGASASRPVLEEALDLCRRHQASLLVQKVDRITRDLEVLARIVKDPLLSVRVASLPNADNFQIHLFGCLAAQEREFISTRTKAALAAAKERGVRLGNPRIAEMNSSRKRTARRFACVHAPLVWSLHNKGRSNQEIADVLNESGFTSPPWMQIPSVTGEHHPQEISRSSASTRGGYQLKVHIQYEDQHHRWHHLQTLHHIPTAVRTAASRASSTGKRHRVVNDDGGLLDLLLP